MLYFLHTMIYDWRRIRTDSGDEGGRESEGQWWYLESEDQWWHLESEGQIIFYAVPLHYETLWIITLLRSTD